MTEQNKRETELLDKLEELSNDSEVDMYSVATLNAYFEECKDVIKGLFEENQQYRAIGTVEELQALKEKSVAKKPILSKSMMTKKEFHICPICERLVLYDGIKFDYCQYCGQHLDWE